MVSNMKTVPISCKFGELSNAWQNHDFTVSFMVGLPFRSLLYNYHVQKFQIFNKCVRKYFQTCPYAVLYHYTLGHSSQIQKGSGIKVLKSSSNFYHLCVSKRDVFSENFCFIAQFNLTLKFQGLFKNFWFANFFDFQGLLLSDWFCCQSYWSYFLNQDQEQFQKHLEQKAEGHFIYNNYRSKLHKNL